MTEPRPLVLDRHDGGTAPQAVVGEIAALAARWRNREWPAAWRLIPQFDRDPKIIAWAQRFSGRGVLLVCFAAVLHALGGSPLVVLAAAVCAYAGEHRWRVIPVLTLILMRQNGFWIDGGIVTWVASEEGVAQQVDPLLLLLLMLVLVFASGAVAFQFWRRLAPAWVVRRSTLVLLGLFFALVVIGQSPACRGLPRVVVWSLIAAWLPFFWFIAYALSDVAAGEPTASWQRLGLLHPFFGATLTPFGKGAAYLRRFEAKTASDLAVTQLKGLKLIIWVALLSICLRILSLFTHGYLQLPTYDDAFAHQLVDHPYPLYVCWGSLISFFFEDLLTISVWGGTIVACARLAGFRLLRNTYKPLAATTIAEFWNRYYFYFKELLVDQFFLPTFFRCFRRHKRLRVFFATFMAASVGNLMFHFMRDIHFIVDMGVQRALAGEESHALYTLLLALGIAFSQMFPRAIEQRRRWWRGQLLPRIRIMVFFCLLHVFDAPLDRVHTVGQHASFFLHLFGLNAWT